MLLELLFVVFADFLELEQSLVFDNRFKGFVRIGIEDALDLGMT